MNGKYAVSVGGVLMLSVWVHSDVTQAASVETDNAVYRQMIDFTSLVSNADVGAHWLSDNTLEWTLEDENGRSFLEADPKANSVRSIFDASRLRTALEKQTGRVFAGRGVPFSNFDYVEGKSKVRFAIVKDYYELDLDSYAVRPIAAPVQSPSLSAQSAKELSLYGPREVPSPSQNHVAIFDNNNLFIRPAQGAPIPLTADGSEWFPWTLRPFSWSSDGTRLLAVRNDWRDVYHMPVVQWLKEGEPVEHALYPYSGGVMEKTELYVLDPSSGAKSQIQAQSEPDQQIWPLSWRKAHSEIFFVRTDRTTKYLQLLVGDAQTGQARVVLTERQPTFVEGVLLSPGVRPQNFFYPLGDGSQFIWRSERSGWSNLYLYDLSGKLLRSLTSGEQPVESVVAVDEEKGWVYFLAAGDRKRPYDLQLYRVNLHGGQKVRLTDGPGVHSISFSPDKTAFVDSYSTPLHPPVTELRRADGTKLRELAYADISKLLALKWRVPEEFTAKAADGKADLYGVLYKPHDFDASKRYPVVEIEYMGNFGSVVPHTFLSRRGNEANALTQLGFIVFIVDGRGTPGRGKAFQDFTYHNIGKIEIPDHVAVLKQVAADRPYMDLSRVAITGGSWGGYFAIRAMLTEPSTYKVGVAAIPVVDLTAARHPIEPYMGLPQESVEGYAQASNIPLADRLQGKLLIIASTSDTNATFSATMRMADAFIKARKHFDLVVLPGEEHNFSPSAYAYYIEAQNSYLVEQLRP